MSKTYYFGSAFRNAKGNFEIIRQCGKIREVISEHSTDEELLKELKRLREERNAKENK